MEAMGVRWACRWPRLPLRLRPHPTNQCQQDKEELNQSQEACPQPTTTTTTTSTTGHPKEEEEAQTPPPVHPIRVVMGHFRLTPSLFYVLFAVTTRPASTTVSGPAKVVRVSSKGPSRRTPSTSAWQIGTVQSTSAEEIGASTAGTRSALPMVWSRRL